MSDDIKITILYQNHRESITDTQKSASLRLIAYLAQKLNEDDFKQLLGNKNAAPHKIVLVPDIVPDTKENYESIARNNNDKDKSLSRWNLKNTNIPIRGQGGQRYLVKFNNYWDNGRFLNKIINFVEKKDIKVTVEKTGRRGDRNQPTENGRSDSAEGSHSPEIRSPSVERSCNLILYGPPGTGKTHATVALAAGSIDANGDIASNWGKMVTEAAKENEKERAKKRQIFAEALGKRVHFITFHQSYSYEDFIGGLRPLTASTQNGSVSEGLSFAWQAGVFIRACAAAWKVAKETGLFTEVSDEDVFTEVSDEDVVGFLDYCAKHNSSPNGNDFRFKDDKVYPSVVLIIDEINRANMSRVFGELITLLEDNKRLGGKETLVVDLPNHPRRAKFSVPKNLLIIGTMNTADKSLALLDLALRRRFEFVRLDPIPGLITTQKFSILLQGLNKAIEKKRRSFDYAVGHAYFPINVEIPDNKVDQILGGIMERKIVPLLQEYFQGNDEDVISVLDSAGVTIASELMDGRRLISKNFKAEFK
jgi:hypothetical protein